MSINLSKDQSLNLSKSDGTNLKEIYAAAGWDVLGGGADLDLMIIATSGKKAKSVQDLVYFNQLNHPTGAIKLSKDNRTGAGERDDEFAIINLEMLNNAGYDGVFFLIDIHSEPGQPRAAATFDLVSNAFVRICDGKDGSAVEVGRYNLTSDALPGTSTALVSACLLIDGKWTYKALGITNKNGIEANLAAFNIV
ncbi:TerD family protein [Cylindrospermopsis raciborskii]|jgi:tellurium resistance protein TerD|uniref:TerD family protein n=1 Tax=Cylindrospermopsis raciborskii TaxID=77022 RepID=UPI003DA6720D|nr:tellurium resistance TerZ family protein [Cyanobacteria bacterium REEB494]